MKKIIDIANAILRKEFLCILVLFIPFLTNAQQRVAVSVVMRPPYSANYAAYENLANHAIITITSPIDMNVFLKGRLSNNQSDFFIATMEDYNPTGAIISLKANQPVVVISDVSKMRFMARNVVTHGGMSDEAWAKLLRDGQLPEGQYDFCVEVMWDSPAGNFISVGDACASFGLTLAQPPVMISPQEGQELNPSLPNTVFSWTPPIGNTIGANIVYDLYVVKVMNGQSPDDAINGAVNFKANNPIIKTNLTANQYVTQPYDLKIDSNTLYAVQVVARDVNRQVSFKNNGRSEVVTFSKGTIKSPGIVITGPANVQLKPSKASFGYEVTNTDPVPFSQVKGKLYYRFKDSDKQLTLPGGKNQNQQGQKQNLTAQLPGQNVQLKGNATTTIDNLIYNKDNTPLYEAKPLAGKTVSLVLTYVFSGTYDGQQLTEIPFNENTTYESTVNGKLKDVDKVLATTVTGNDGSFTFNFVNSFKDLGLADAFFNFHTGGEFGHNVEGQMYKVLRVRVEDKYYCSPDVNIKIDPWKGVDVGTLVSFVKSYTLKVKVTTTNGKFWDMVQGQGSPLSGITTTIIRKGVLSGPPPEEGGYKPGQYKTIGNERTLTSEETDKDGYAYFYHLVQHNPDNKQDRYYIKCVPDEKKGNFIFKEKEQSYYPLYNKDLAGFPFNDVGQYTPSGSGIALPVPYGQDITWNHQLEIKTYSKDFQLYPQKPRIAGKVQDATNVDAKAMANKKVVMINNYSKDKDPSKLFTVVKTDNAGRYEFNNLDMELGDFKAGEITSVIGPTRTIIAKPDGYKAITLPGSKQSDSIWSIKEYKGIDQTCKGCYPPLKWGQQLLNQDFFLTPDGILSGYVVDEKGNPVKADIDVDGLTKTSTQVEFIYDDKTNKNQSGNFTLLLPTGTRQKFEMAAPSGSRKITITPTDNAYTPLDTTLTIPKDGSKISPIKFMVMRSQKRIRFRIAEATGNSRLKLPANIGKAIAGASVKLDLPGEPITQISDKDGYVTFIFDNSSSKFDFIISPPANEDYEVGYFSISNAKNTTKTITYGNAYLKKAATITGLVTIGTDKKPLQGAKVYIETGGGKKIETQTGADGNYILKGVPTSPSEKIVWAGKPGVVPNIISQNKKMTIGSKNELDFNLITDNELVIENIFGFEVEIQSKTKQNDDTWLVSGNLIKLPANDNFSLRDGKQSIPFSNLKIKKSGETKNGIPVGIPTENILTTDLANIKLVLQNNFWVVQKPSSGDQLLVKADNQKGSVTGKVALEKSSFKFTQNYVTFNNDPNEALLLTEKPGSFNTDLASITINTSSKKKFGVADLKGQKLSYTLLGFKADADAAGSWIQDNSISLQTVIHINSLPGMNPSTLDVNAGNLVIHPDKFEPLKGDQPISFKLEKWQFTGNNWQLQQGSSSIDIATGTIKTGSIDVPLKNISLKPNGLSISSFDVNNLTLAGIIPVNVITTKPAFGYNKTGIGSDQKPHYELRLVGENGGPGVTIKSLPGMKAGQEMKFQNFSLISNGEQIVNPGNQGNSIVFYSVMKVKPLAFTSDADYVNMDCGIDLGIPQLKQTSGVIQFRKEAGSLKLLLYPLNVSLNGPGGVDFSANVQFNDHPQNLTEGNFTALGTIRDKEGIVLKGLLTRTPQEAWIKVDPENQKLPLGGGNTSLANIKGRMDADMTAGVWKNFSFSGEMQGFKGMQGDTRKTFVVTGAINASNQKIDVKNIPSGFGNIGLTYDIANSRFTGNLQLDKNIGPLSMAGTADLLADAGGWYFLAGGKLTAPGLGGMSAGLLIGDYAAMPSNVSSTLMQFAYDKHVPPSFQNGISGFFFTGMKELPVINIPNYSIDLGVISASFGAQAGLDARLWMDFTKTGNEYGIGAMAFAHAYLKGASITCTRFGADARAELGLKGTYYTSSGNFALKGCGSFTISGSIQQCVPTLCWDGICCEWCHGVGVSKGIKVELTLDSGGNTDLSFGFGNCSGQSTMTGNW